MIDIGDKLVMVLIWFMYIHLVKKNGNEQLVSKIIYLVNPSCWIQLGTHVYGSMPSHEPGGCWTSSTPQPAPRSFSDFFRAFSALATFAWSFCILRIFLKPRQVGRKEWKRSDCADGCGWCYQALSWDTDSWDFEICPQETRFYGVPNLNCTKS